MSFIQQPGDIVHFHFGSKGFTLANKAMKSAGALEAFESIQEMEPFRRQRFLIVLINNEAQMKEIAMKKELVRDWMTHEVVTVNPDTTVPDAHKLMTEEEIRRLPVVDRKGRLVGIVTLGDVRGAEPSSATSLSIWEMNYLLSRLTVKQIMKSDLITVAPEATIGEAATKMLANRVAGLPVVDEKDNLVGIITESDIFSMVVLHEWAETQREEEYALRVAS